MEEKGEEEIDITNCTLCFGGKDGENIHVVLMSCKLYIVKAWRLLNAELPVGKRTYPLYT
jgi:hypothetical protein